MAAGWAAGRHATVKPRQFSTFAARRKEEEIGSAKESIDINTNASGEDVIKSETTIIADTSETSDQLQDLLETTEADALRKASEATNVAELESAEESIIESSYEVLDDPPLAPTEPYVPWYLQHQRPKAPDAPRDPLPELPESPPPILEPVVNHLDEALGIRKIKLLDLRPISDTVPLPLGSDLIMLFGTCRSERHLHMSADKLCRFIRSNYGEEYGLSPHADGLMGRNELKLRERRRRRRGKPSTQAIGQVEEETRIEWVCVTLGQGVVVQLFTEGRREELDLEGLWRKNMDRELKRIEKWEAEAAEKEAALEALESGVDPKKVAEAVEETVFDKVEVPEEAVKEVASEVLKEETVKWKPAKPVQQ